MSDASHIGYGLAPAKTATAEAFDPVFTGRRRVAYGFGILCWLAALGFFWIWWCQSAHIISWTAFVLITAVLAWITLVPAYFILIFLDARTISSRARLPEGRVAMVVTKGAVRALCRRPHHAAGDARSDRRRVRRLAGPTRILPRKPDAGAPSTAC